MSAGTDGQGDPRRPHAAPAMPAARSILPRSRHRAGAGTDRHPVPAVTRVQEHATLLAGAATALVAFALYVMHVLPGVAFWDTGIYQWAAATLNLTHPTGFPLYILLGHSFIQLVPAGDPAFRMNLLAAVSGAAAVAALFALARAYGASTWIAAAAALTFGLEQAFWRTAVRADPHTLHAFLALLVLGMAILWHRRGHPSRLLVATSFAYGLALTNHLLMAMLAPALAAFVLWSEPRLLREPLRIGRVLGAGLLGTLVYLYVPITAMLKPTVTVTYSPATWDGFWTYATGGEFRSGMGFLSLGGPAQAIGQLPEFASSLGRSLSVPGATLILVLALAGALIVARRDRRELALLAIAGGLTLYAALTFNDSDVERYYFVPVALLVLLAAVGADWLLSPGTLAGLLRSSARAAPAIALVVPAVIGWSNASRVDPISAQCYVDAVLSTVKPHALVMSWWLDSTSLLYEVDVLRRRPDVTVFNGMNEVPGKLRDLADQRPVYLVQPEGIIDTLRGEYQMEELSACGTPLYEVMPSAAPPG